MNRNKPPWIASAVLVLLSGIGAIANIEKTLAPKTAIYLTGVLDAENGGN